MTTAQTMAMKFRQRDERLAAHPEQLRARRERLLAAARGMDPERVQARLELRRSNAAQPHRNRKKYDRNDKSWKREV